MKYGEKHEAILVDRFTKNRIPYISTYKYVEYREYHTNNEGEGLWHNNK